MVRKILKWIGIVLGALIVLVGGLVVFVVASGQGQLNLPVRHTEAFEHPEVAAFPSMLRAQGNELVNAERETVRLRGLMPIDPSELHSQNRFNRRFFEEMQAQGANVVRLPVHPREWEEDPDYLWRYIDRAVGWAGELDMYLIIDWHSIGNVQTGAAPLMPDLYAHTYEMTADFWRQTAAHFRDTPNVLFEVFNEPQGILAANWHRSATELVGIVRAQGAEQPVIVGGVEYARDLSWVLQTPVEDDNVVYAAHIYPAHAEVMWGTYFGDVSERYPVLVTEWGFMDENASADKAYLNGNAEEYGRPLMAYLDERGIGWTACWYDDGWDPPMFTPGWDTLTNYGAFVTKELAQ
ncbi:MAG: glycoside hydrolase family 5 protein [Anaerolineae bacterium]|jgi:aryl-phospho-beta-D-glucosidase BglC (GH1 family)